MVDIADRAGVAASSLYRRWGDVRTLLTEVAVERLMREAHLPDTGSLHGDLSTWARAMATGLADPKNAIFFRVYIGAAPRSQEEGAARAKALSGRLQQIGEMLTRAELRGEKTPQLPQVADHILAPLYMRALFGAPASPAIAEQFVVHLLSSLSFPEPYGSKP